MALHWLCLITVCFHNLSDKIFANPNLQIYWIDTTHKINENEKKKTILSKIIIKYIEYELQW